MDDDTQRTLKVTIAGTEYPAAPFGETQVMALQMVKSVSGSTVISILSGLIKFSFGEEVRDKVLTLLASGDLGVKELIAILMDVATAQAEAQEAAEESTAKAVARASKPRKTASGRA